MNLAQSLRDYYASPVSAHLRPPDLKGYIDDISLAACDERPPKRASPHHSVEPIDAPWHAADQLLATLGRPVVYWRIDGASNFGIRLYACPISLLPNLPPRLIDVYIPDQTCWPANLRDVLDASKSAHMLDGRFALLGIAKQLVFALEYWSTQMVDFEVQYRKQPYGSAIVVENVAANVADMRIRFSPNPHLVEKMLPWQTLQRLWGVAPDAIPILAVEDLHFKAQIQKSVVLVELPADAGGFVAIYKSRPQRMNGLYHEIKNLLRCPPGPNIFVELLFLVTVRSLSSNEPLVSGCILRYHKSGTMQEALPRRRLAGTLAMRDQLRWARQLTSALVRVTYQKPRRYYSDLKMDNILISSDGEDASVLLIDHEQDRTIFACAPPEIYYIDWLYELADTDALGPFQEKCRLMLDQYLDSKGVRTPFQERDRPYYDAPNGYYFPWLASSDDEREAAEVFMLGKALWCIFEGVGEPCNILGRSAIYESGLEFPEFRRTPEPLRRLIQKCTRGAREWSTGPLQVFRCDSKIYPRGRTGADGQPAATVEETKRVIEQTWRTEIQKIIDFVQAKQRYDEGNATVEDYNFLGYLERPKLKEVLNELEKFQL